MGVWTTEKSYRIEVCEFKQLGVYELLNGLVDLNRDILMKLVKIVGDEIKIRSVIGICNAFYEWCKRRNFRFARFPIKLPLELIPQSEIITLDMKIRGFISLGVGSFLNKELNYGIFNIVFEGVGSIYHLCGVVHKWMIHRIFEYFCVVPGSCGMCSSGIDCGNERVVNEDLFDKKWHKLMLELNMNQTHSRTLHFFVDGKQIQYSVTNIPQTVHFFFGTLRGTPLKVQSFRQLMTPTANNALKSAEYEWR